MHPPSRRLRPGARLTPLLTGPRLAGCLLAALLAGCSGGAASPSPSTAGSAGSGGDPWAEARERGVDFRAVGQEPGWWLEIDGADIELAVDYGERRLTVRDPKRELQEGRRIYRGEADGQSVEVTLEKRRCEDVMSGEPFPTTVTLELDGTTYRGCGRALR